MIINGNPDVLFPPDTPMMLGAISAENDGGGVSSRDTVLSWYAQNPYANKNPTESDIQYWVNELQIKSVGQVYDDFTRTVDAVVAKQYPVSGGGAQFFKDNPGVPLTLDDLKQAFRDTYDSYKQNWSWVTAKALHDEMIHLDLSISEVADILGMSVADATTLLNPTEQDRKKFWLQSGWDSAIQAVHDFVASGQSEETARRTAAIYLKSTLSDQNAPVLDLSNATNVPVATINDFLSWANLPEKSPDQIVSYINSVLENKNWSDEQKAAELKYWGDIHGVNITGYTGYITSPYFEYVLQLMNHPEIFGQYSFEEYKRVFVDPKHASPDTPYPVVTQNQATNINSVFSTATTTATTSPTSIVDTTAPSMPIVETPKNVTLFPDSVNTDSVTQKPVDESAYFAGVAVNNWYRNTPGANKSPTAQDVQYWMNQIALKGEDAAYMDFKRTVAVLSPTGTQTTATTETKINPLALLAIASYFFNG